MICPYCNEEMQHGYITSGMNIDFSKSKRGIVPSPDSIMALDVWYKCLISGANVGAFHCDKCKKIIIDLVENKR